MVVKILPYEKVLIILVIYCIDFKALGCSSILCYYSLNLALLL